MVQGGEPTAGGTVQGGRLVLKDVAGTRAWLALFCTARTPGFQLAGHVGPSPKVTPASPAKDFGAEKCV